MLKLVFINFLTLIFLNYIEKTNDIILVIDISLKR